MLWLEMSRDPIHGGETWGFTECLWAPSRKGNGARWPFWELLLRVKKDDLIIHLRGERAPEFVGFSIAAENGYETTRRPPMPEQWGFAKTFFRAALKDYTPFKNPISLADVLYLNDAELRTYFTRNRELTNDAKRRLFYVVQAGRLQCLNGAYLSEIDHELAGILFGDRFIGELISPRPQFMDVETRQQLRQIYSRVGQQAFSQAVKANYETRCCFPGCEVNDESFLVGAHIARWSDVPELRGDISNGLCFCLMHDRAFELGLFTITRGYTIWVNKQEIQGIAWALQNLLPFHGQYIHKGRVVPSEDALKHHWERIGCIPAEFN